MSDQGKFINTYIDVIIGSVHEMLNTTYQVKTQLKMANEIISQKDEEIASLREHIENSQRSESAISDTIKSNNEEINRLRSSISSLESENTALKTKQSHFDSSIQQIIEMKNEIKKRDSIILEKEKQIEELNFKLEEEKKKKTMKEVKKLKQLEKINDEGTLNSTELFTESKDDF